MTKQTRRRNRPALALHVPEPPSRPGEPPDFSAIAVPPAGSAPRPDIGAAAAETHPLATALIRVLDDEHRAVGPWNPWLDSETLRAMLREMVALRAFDDRMFRAQRQGKTSFYMKASGEEAVAIAATHALDFDDMCFPSYRQQGILIARGYPLLTMMCQVYSNAGDPLHGRQLPIMYSSREYGFFSISGNLATQYPQAVGWAMASAIKGDSRIAMGWIGEGATAEGDFHAAMTFASVYLPPVILAIVNNQWAISSYYGIAGGEQATFAQRAIGYGLPCLRVDGNDALAVYAATAWAAERARSNRGPTVIEYFSYRAESHSSSDDPTAYRSVGEAQAWPLGDPVERLKQHLIGIDEWDEDRHVQLVTATAEQIRGLQKQAEKLGTLPTQGFERIGSMFEDVFAHTPWHLREQREEALAEAREYLGHEVE